MARKKTTVFDDLEEFFFAVPWWLGPLVAGAVFAALRYGLPLFLANVLSQKAHPVVEAANKTFVQMIGGLSVTLAPVIAGLVLFVWVLSLLRKLARRELFKRTQSREEIEDLSWRQFEYLIGEYYRQRGYRVEEHGGAQPDGGIDLILFQGTDKVLVQCKHWKQSTVGIKPVRELLGVMTDAEASAGILVTSGVFSAEALAFAQKNRIKLIDGMALAEMIRLAKTRGSEARAYAPEPRPETPVPFTRPNTPACPQCGGPMVIRTAKTGPYAGSSFYGCSRFPACRGIRGSSE